MIKSIIYSTIWVFLKDMKSEFRTRYAISSLFLFILVSVSVVIFSTSDMKLTPVTASGIFWIIIFFSSMTGLSRSFVSEEERGTSFLLKIHAPLSAVYFGKLIFNITLCFALNVLAAILFFIFFDYLGIAALGDLVLTLVFSSFGLASATTIISAIIAKANSRNSLFPLLSFPVLLPLIIVGIELTRYAIDAGGIDSPWANYRLMFSYSGIMITASYFLFEFIWND